MQSHASTAGVAWGAARARSADGPGRPGREGKGRGEIARVGRRLGVRPEAVRTWILLHLLVPHLAGRRLPPRFFVQ